MGRGHDNRRRAFALAAACSVLILLAAATGAWASPAPDRAAATGAAALVSAPVHVQRPAAGSVAGIWQAVPGAIMRASPTALGDIFYNGFEEASLPWGTGCTNPGDPTWGITTHRAAAGAKSAYCCGSTIPPPGPYADNMNSWIVTVPPIDLTGVEAAIFEYRFWLDSEVGHDQLQATVSTDGSHFYGTGWWGVSGGWMTDSIDLTNVPTLGNVCGQSVVYLAFFFVSDDSTTAEGAYVDEVRVFAPAPVKPKITRLSPTAGKRGATVTITGSGFGAKRAKSFVKFGATKATKYTTWTDTKIKCKVPAKASFGKLKVKVTTAAGVSNAKTFKVKK